MFSDNFDFVKGGKLPGTHKSWFARYYSANLPMLCIISRRNTHLFFSGFYGGSGSCSGCSDSYDCFSSRFMWRTDGDIEIYGYIENEEERDYCEDDPNVVYVLYKTYSQNLRVIWGNGSYWLVCEGEISHRYSCFYSFLDAMKIVAIPSVGSLHGWNQVDGTESDSRSSSTIWTKITEGFISMWMVRYWSKLHGVKLCFFLGLRVYCHHNF